MTIAVSIGGRRERIVRWWARRQKQSVDATVKQVFNSFFTVVPRFMTRTPTRIGKVDEGDRHR